VNKQVDVDRRLSFADMARRLTTVVVCSSLVLAAAQAASAQERERGGKEIVETVCAVCHRTGVNGAPTIGDRKAWAKLTSQGLTSLTGIALKGVRKMPPHGGNPNLTDTEIERAITYMVNQSGGDWIEPVSKVASAVPRSGGEVVQAYCAKCHQTGAMGAPGIGDRAAWIPRLKQGFDVLVRSAIMGHGPMPSRGDATNLTDSEIRAAIAYMINGDTVGMTRPPVALAAGPDPKHQINDGAEKYPGMVSWLRLFWTQIWGNSEIPKQAAEHELTRP
jgi:cytochrome c5